MIKEVYKVIGVMSGTSLDGIDLAHILFKKKEKWSFQILETATVPYSEEWLDTLSDLVSKSSSELTVIDNHYTSYLAQVIKNFVSENRISDIDAICSHGHTALHQPEMGLTYQIGNLPELSTIAKHMVICDFRVQDVKLGGQGAPLVPIGDDLLFSDYDYCLNLGGFANISTEVHGKRIAYDICPVNVVLNYFSKQLGYDYDDMGELSRQGKIESALLDELNELPFYSKNAPKSLGFEWVKENILPVISSFELEIKDTLRTLVEHIAFQISKSIEPKKSVLISGGGAYNLFLIERIKTLSRANIIIPENSLVEYKEALIFGLLGILKLRGDINCLASVTGAKHNHSSGKIYYP